MIFGLAPPKNIKNLFENCAVIWTMWNTRNDFIFNKTKIHSFLQVIPMTVQWICTWSYLQQEEQRDAIVWSQLLGYIQPVRLAVA
jgi:hypothetical protein